MRMTPEDRFDRQPWRGASGALIAADVRLDNRDEVLARIGIAPRTRGLGRMRACCSPAWEKFGDALWPMLRGPFAVAIWDPRRRALTLARDHLGLNVVMWHKSARFFAFATMPNGLFALADVPRRLSEEKFADFLVLNHADHATTIYRDVFRAAAGACDAGRGRRFVRATSLLVAGRHHAGRACFRRGLCRGLARTPRYRGAPADAQRPSGRLPAQRRTRFFLGRGARRPGAGREERTARGLHRRAAAGFDGAGAGRSATPTRHLMSRRFARRPAISTSPMSENDGCDDFAELERFFIALEGPVRNPTNLGWMLAILRLARAQGRRVLLGGLSWQPHHKLERLVAGRRAPQCAGGCSRRCDSGNSSIAVRLIRAGWRCRSFSSSRCCRSGLSDWAESPPPSGASRLGSDHAAIRPDFAADMASPRAPEKAGHDFLYRMRPGERLAALDASRLCSATGSRPRRQSPASRCAIPPPTSTWFRSASAFRRSSISPKASTARWCAAPCGDCSRQTCDQSHERPASGGLVREARRRRASLAQEIAELSQSPLVRRAIDLDRLERAVENWPTGGWHTEEIFEEYNLALTRGVAGGRFLRWMESVNG